MKRVLTRERLPDGDAELVGIATGEDTLLLDVAVQYVASASTMLNGCDIISATAHDLMDLNMIMKYLRDSECLDHLRTVLIRWYKPQGESISGWKPRAHITPVREARRGVAEGQETGRHTGGQDPISIEGSGNVERRYAILGELDVEICEIACLIQPYYFIRT